MTARFYSAKVGERPETPAPPFRAGGDALKSIRVPTDDLKVEMRHFNEDIQFVNDNAREIRRLHPDQWVAVYDKQVVGADEDFRLLMKDLKALGYPLKCLLVRRVEINPMNLIV